MGGKRAHLLCNSTVVSAWSPSNRIRCCDFFFFLNRCKIHPVASYAAHFQTSSKRRRNLLLSTLSPRGRRSYCLKRDRARLFRENKVLPPKGGDLEIRCAINRWSRAGMKLEPCSGESGPWTARLPSACKESEVPDRDGSRAPDADPVPDTGGGRSAPDPGFWVESLWKWERSVKPRPGLEFWFQTPSWPRMRDRILAWTLKPILYLRQGYGGWRPPSWIKHNPHRFIKRKSLIPWAAGFLGTRELQREMDKTTLGPAD